MKPYVCLLRSVSCTLLALILFGCSSGVKGVYVCKGGFLDTLNLQSDGKLYATASMFGMKQERVGTYTVDGDRIVMTVNGESSVFHRKGKRLDGGELLGLCTLK